jgi:hypothetical protein
VFGWEDAEQALVTCGRSKRAKSESGHRVVPLSRLSLGTLSSPPRSSSRSSSFTTTHVSHDLYPCTNPLVLLNPSTPRTIPPPIANHPPSPSSLIAHGFLESRRTRRWWCWKGLLTSPTIRRRAHSSSAPQTALAVQVSPPPHHRFHPPDPPQFTLHCFIGMFPSIRGPPSLMHVASSLLQRYGSCVPESLNIIQIIRFQSYDPTIEDAYRKQLLVDDRMCFVEVIDTAGQGKTFIPPPSQPGLSFNPEEYATLRDQWVRCAFPLLPAMMGRSRSLQRGPRFYSGLLHRLTCHLRSTGDIPPVHVTCEARAAGFYARWESERQGYGTTGFKGRRIPNGPVFWLRFHGDLSQDSLKRRKSLHDTHPGLAQREAGRNVTFSSSRWASGWAKAQGQEASEKLYYSITDELPLDRRYLSVSRIRSLSLPSCYAHNHVSCHLLCHRNVLRSFHFSESR